MARVLGIHGAHRLHERLRQYVLGRRRTWCGASGRALSVVPCQGTCNRVDAGEPLQRRGKLVQGGAWIHSRREFAMDFMDPQNTRPRILGVDFGARRTGLAVTVDAACRKATAIDEIAVPRVRGRPSRAQIGASGCVFVCTGRWGVGWT